MVTKSTNDLKLFLSSCKKQQVDVHQSSHLRSQFKLDLIHEDESVGVVWLWPAQKHPVLVAFPGHLAGYVISLFWRTASRTGYHGDHTGNNLKD